MIKRRSLLLVLSCLVCILYANRPMEYLDRGLVAMEANDGVYLSWRILGVDSMNVGFNLYRNGEKINASLITESSNYQDVSLIHFEKVCL